MFIRIWDDTGTEFIPALRFDVMASIMEQTR